jgi:phosphatidylserine/phosphatidylglycerophosphate/cardiolipin synthase-like enzyme
LDASRDALDGDSYRLAPILRGLSAAGRRDRGKVDLVWSGPTPPGAEGRSTYALAADLIDEADHRVIAATYSVSTSSPYVKALKRAVARDVDVTVLVDPEHQVGGVTALISALPGVRFLRMPTNTKGVWAAMHAKFVVVDDQVAFVTSANFSDAAADRNLELGVIVDQQPVARALTKHVEDLKTARLLVNIAEGVRVQ